MTDYGNDVYGVDSAWGYFETDNATTKVNQERHYRRTYVWDVRNRLTESHDSTNDVYYVYGEDGMRTNKYTRNAETIYFSNFWTWHKDGGSEYNGGKNSKHIFLGTERLVTKVNSANSPHFSEEFHSQYFYHSDHLGSAQLVTNQVGEVYQRIEYTPYGETWIDMRTNITALYDVPYRFTAKELDKETGLYYYGARYLDPKYSRWISTDPALGEYIPAAGKANAKDMANLPGMGGIFNHTNAGLFHYAGNNPVRYIDPDGKKIIVDGDTENLNTILELINSLSETQYKYKENNELEIDNTKINRRGSSIYSNAINSLINDGTTTIQIANTYKDENGNQIPIPKSTDGTTMPGYTYGSNAAKIMNVSITGCSGAIIPTVAGFAQEASPAEVLMHELAGHANPRIRGIVGNAVAIDNSIRCELLLRSGGVAPKLRMPDEKHGTHRVINK